MNKKPRKSPKVFAVFNSLEEENEAEYRRMREMTPEQRLDEFCILQKRVWGRKWTHSRIKKVVSIEIHPW